MPKKDPFENLEEAFKDAVAGATVEELKSRFSEVAKNEEANKSAKKADPDLNRLVEQVKVASAGYAEVSKANRLKLKCIIRHLADKGDAVAQTIVQNDIDAELQKAGG